jgi:hypothetical protein
MKAHHAQVLDRLVAAKGDKRFKESIGPKAFQKM